ncbi:MAG: thioredoxin [Planctomycetaceae bacterium]|nr:thioredoxin [Planctomycetaceae bacterium]
MDGKSRTYLAILVIFFSATGQGDAATPTVEQTMQLRPIHRGIEYETPKSSEWPQCRVEGERTGKGSGWVVLGPTGQVLRRFKDTNGDNIVDQWCYYNRGVEVYRDSDSNYNNKVDQSRWLNTGGSKWAIDSNEDGRIDSWKTLSAEEATQVAVTALLNNDSAALAKVLVSEADIQSLGIEKKRAGKLLESTSDLSGKMRAALSRTRKLTRSSKWLRFDATKPGVIPADLKRANKDLHVYENVMTIVATGNETTFVQIGEMVRVGDTWKLTQVPQPLEGNDVPVTEWGPLMQPDLNVPQATVQTQLPGSLSPEQQKLLEQLEQLDKRSPQPADGQAAFAQYNSKRADVLNKLISLSKTDAERERWTRQMIDGLSLIIQTGGNAETLTRLKGIESDLRRGAPRSKLTAYAVYRRMFADYIIASRTATSVQQPKVQEKWYADLATYIESYPQGEEVPEAMMQLAIAQEFMGKIPEAKQWYSRLASEHGKTQHGRKAAGALRRIGLPGKTLELSGPSLDGGGAIDLKRLRGRVVLVYFWSTWCRPCTEDLPQILNLYAQHRNQGFEIVGINLDNTKEPVRPFLTQQRVGWPQIFHPGGLESTLSIDFGIMTLPTMFLVDKRGIVVNRNITVADLKRDLPELLKK